MKYEFGKVIEYLGEEISEGRKVWKFGRVNLGDDGMKPQVEFSLLLLSFVLIAWQ